LLKNENFSAKSFPEAQASEAEGSPTSLAMSINMRFASSLYFVCSLFVLGNIHVLRADPVAKDTLPKASQPKSEVSPEKKPSLYRQLLKPVDIFALPADESILLTIEQFHRQLLANNLAIRQAKYDYESSQRSYLLVFKELRPKFALSSSARLSYDYTNENRSTSDSRDLGLAMNGSTDWGVSYGVNFPRISFSKSKADVDPAETTTSGITGDAQVSLNLLRDSAFRVGGNRVKNARFAGESAKLGYRGALLSTLYDSQALYFQVFSSQAELVINEYSLKTSEALLEESRELYRLGEIAKAELVQVELQVENARSSLINVQTARDLAQESFREALNTDTTYYPNPQDLTTLPPKPVLELEKVLATARENRTDYLKAQQDIEQSKIGLADSYNGLWPSLTLTANS
jgi:outer membrane protein TolC